MSLDSAVNVTCLIDAAQGGDGQSAAKLLPLVYEQLRQLARQRMAAQPASHTLHATALVHEAYIRLVGGEISFAGRKHFFFAAAEAMRHILIDHARARGGPKRGGGRRRLPFNNLMDLAADEAQLPEILALDEALSRLQQQWPDVAAMVRLRFYGGLSIEEAAEALEVSPRTVKRNWTFARAWLLRELG